MTAIKFPADAENTPAEGLHLNIFSRGGMDKTQSHGVLGLSLEFKGTFPVSADLIAKKGMADGGHVDANLVGSTCLQHALYISVFFKTLKDAIMGRCSLAVSSSVCTKNWNWTRQRSMKKQSMTGITPSSSASSK